MEVVMKIRILIVDDEETIRLSLEEALKDLGYSISTAATGHIALEKVKEYKPQIVFLDMRLAGENGLDILPKIKKIDKKVEVIIMTAYGDINTAVKAIKLGAFDYINKPFDLIDVEILIKRITENLKLQNKI